MAGERKAISKKMRFSVFKRDCFKCQYCGKTPPTVVLEIDHIVPVSAGGENGIDNLLTACFECNRGKGAELLSS
ncbi:MAG: HNH endonuclease, partial [Bradyrhizobium sp.]|nr:HNH endonuclease [Bradyrhizobium sp.]